MNLRRFRLQDFRNIASAEIEFSGLRTFFVGRNGQGKTNLLEAAGYISALRAFRPGGNRVLIREGAREAALGYAFDHENFGSSELTVRIRRQGKVVELERNPVKRLADVIGRFPCVLFAAEDIHLIRGAPAVRRRFLDLHLASLDPGYLTQLQRYHRALEQRNRLLKTAGTDIELVAFERELASAGAAVVRERSSGVAALGQQMQRFFSGLTAEQETAALSYQPDTNGDEHQFLEMWERQRARDRQLKATAAGPHRDDLALSVRARPANLYASEGQQRALVLALRFAQLADARVRTGLAPVILADDVLGELDQERRARFWTLLDSDVQLLATGTQIPADEPKSWQIIHVTDGRFE